MGETEVIKGLTFLKEKLYNGIFQDRLKCIDLAIAALEEVQKYRQIGTVEECREAVEKQKSKSPNLEGDGYDEDGEMIYDTWICPSCGEDYEVDYDDYDFCPNCGQRILH